MCGTCIDARNFGDMELLEGARRSTMDELANATVEAVRDEAGRPHSTLIRLIDVIYRANNQNALDLFVWRLTLCSRSPADNASTMGGCFVRV